MNLQITFRLDGAGLYHDPHEPLHLDALLAWALAPHQSVPHNLGRDDPVTEVALPLTARHLHGEKVWCASALFPAPGAQQTLTHWRKRLRQGRIELTAGSPNLTNGVWRDWNMPLPLTLTPTMVGWASGSGSDVRKLLRQVRYLGKKRAHGHGKVVCVEVEPCEDDRALTWQGRATRYLPDPTATRLVRPRPPYWNNTGRVRCCEIGAAYKL